MSQVGNKNIDNASGQVVRIDIQNTLKAVASNNFGAKASAGEIEPAEFVADNSTTPKKLLIRSTSGASAAASATFFEVGNLDEANLGLLPKAGGTMTGPLLGDDGSAAASPAYAFDGDADTGMFRSGANTIGFATAGNTRALISDAGLDITNGLPLRLQDNSGSPFTALKSAASLSSNLTFTLPSTIVNGGFLQTDNSGNLSFSLVAGVPTGSVFCMAIASVPSGYLECNGAAVSRTTYAALFTVIGTQYGTGDGATTFGLPDLRGEFIRGFDNNRGVDSGRSIGSTQTAQNQAHDHDADATAVSSVTDPGHKHTTLGHGTDDDGGGRVTGSGDGGSSNSSMNNNSTGISVATSVSIDIDNEGGESRPRNVAMMYIIKV
tara:strand:- start:6577 stop:7713 length:1137 start_codon:yes stop_codon:yes gene_type:complete